MVNKIVIQLLHFCILFLPICVDAQWQELDTGLELGLFPSPVKSEIHDSKIRVLRIDPREYKLVLLNASANSDKKIKTARQWSAENKLTAAINSSMYKEDYLTSVAYMRSGKHINNGILLKKDKAMFAFDRKSYDFPLVKLIDHQCDGFLAPKSFYRWSLRYGTLVQSIRMITCRGKNVWRQQAKKWSTALIATDKESNVLFVHVRSPYSTHDLIDILLKLPLNIDRAMYAEGGPEAQLYIKTDDREYEFIGSYETGFNENDDNQEAWPIPNVIGIRKFTQKERIGIDYRHKKKEAKRRQLEMNSKLETSGGVVTADLLHEAETSLLKTVQTDLIPSWYNMEWDFNGHSQIPQQGKIACGYFVTTILRDAGYNMDRVSLARQPSSHIIKSLVDKKYVKAYSNTPIEKFVASVKSWGEGLYIVGLDIHVGFLLYQDKKLRFIHSSYLPPETVIGEVAEDSKILISSKYRVVGKLLPNPELMRKWINGEKIETVVCNSCFAQ